MSELTTIIRILSALTVILLCVYVYFIWDARQNVSISSGSTSTTPSNAISTDSVDVPSIVISQLGCTEIPGYRIPGAGYKLGTELADAVYPGFGTSVSNIVQCIESCSTDDDCKQYTFNTADKTCYKQKTRYPFTTDNKLENWVSGTCTRRNNLTSK